MKFLTQFLIVFLIVGIQQNSRAQSTKKLLKEAQKDYDNKLYQEAILKLNDVIKLEPQNDDALALRGQTFKATQAYENAIADFKSSVGLNPKNVGVLYELAETQFLTNLFIDANITYERLIQASTKFPDAYQKKAFCLYKMRDFNGMLTIASQGTRADKDDEWCVYYMAVAYDSLGNKTLAEQQYQKAIDLVKSDKRKSLNALPYNAFFIGLGNTQLDLYKYDLSIATYTVALKTEPENADLLRKRARVYVIKQEYQNALNDLNQSIALNDKNYFSFLDRAYVYKKLGQYQSAINDFGQSTIINPGCADGFSGRAQCFYQTGNYKESVNDFKKALKLKPNESEWQKGLNEAKVKFYETNKETTPPVLRLLNEKGIETEEINVREDAKSIKLKLVVNDQSPLKSLIADAKIIETDDEKLNPEFEFNLPIGDKKTFEIKATDVYLNQTSKVYHITRTEIEGPIVTLTTPFPAEGQLFIEAKPNLYIEGKIKDKSKIKSIYINETFASFSPDVENPNFTANIAINLKDSLIIKATDIYDNESNTRFKVTREDTTGANPMGLTWVVFIENAEYKNLQKLEGPPRDIRDLKSSLTNYQVDKFIHKPNMSKEQLDKFFRIELRDMVQKNRVKSLMIWYAGHGKFLNETGYWIPIDGDSYDEYSYYSINVLRSSLQSYTALKHILVVSDACESGPAFYMAMRDELKGKTCDTWDPTKFRSAQVFTSSNKEFSSDNSLFTQAFVHTLQNNKQSCISIESIAEKVSGVVKQNLKQSPKFGKIKGLEDEDGSFFFLKKE